MKVRVERIEPKSDARGSVWEPVTEADLKTLGNCHVVITEPGGLRGNHHHRVGTEVAIQRGPALVVYADETGRHEVTVAPGEIVRLTIPPRCPHAFLNNGTEPNILVAFNTEVFDPNAPDAFRDPVIEL